MADGITIRIVGDDSDFMRTLASLEEQTRATLDGLAAAASLAGEAFGAALGGAGGFDLGGDEEELARRTARLAETVARAWSGAAVLEAPSLAAPQGLLDLGPLLERAFSSLEANLSAAAEDAARRDRRGAICAPDSRAWTGRASPRSSRKGLRRRAWRARGRWLRPLLR